MYMLDTNMCIFIIKKKKQNVLDKLKLNKDKGLLISAITLAELEFGCANADVSYSQRNKAALLEFLTILNIKQFDENAAKEFGAIKKELKDKKCLIGPFDMLIGAHAKSLNLTLVTNNTSEFMRITDLKIEDWT